MRSPKSLLPYVASGMLYSAGVICLEVPQILARKGIWPEPDLLLSAVCTWDSTQSCALAYSSCLLLSMGIFYVELPCLVVVHGCRFMAIH